MGAGAFGALKLWGFSGLLQNFSVPLFVFTQLMLRSRPEQLKLGIDGARCVDE